MLLYRVWICIPRTFCFQNRSSNFTPDYMALAVSETDDITHESIQCVPACIKPFLPNGNAQLPGRSNSDALDFKHCPRSFHTHSRIRKQICSLMPAAYWDGGNGLAIDSNPVKSSAGDESNSTGDDTVFACVHLLWSLSRNAQGPI